MRPAFSVVFLTTLIGAGQGLFLAVYAADLLAGRDIAPMFSSAGVALAIALAALGLVASFFHLGRPERAWRAATRWRSSWLSREVIALPVFMALAFAYGTARASGWAAAPLLGASAAAAALALFVCTAMIYACMRFLQEWASRYTLPNFVLMGCASGAMIACALSALLAPALTRGFAAAAAILTVVALFTRMASLARNARIRPRSTPQSAIGIDDPVIRQKSQGFTASSFNTQEFFHGVSAGGMRGLRLAFLQLAFVIPVLLVMGGMRGASASALAAACLVQYAGLAIERWYFLADASHPQNLYYQRRS